ncbi:MAG: polysaccharide deacetylase family protein [Candidatus Brocadiia bacterium]
MSALALTVDLEPDWGMHGTRAYRRVTPRFLRFLEDRGFRATFFVVSDLLDVSEDIVAGLGEAHEVASHGASHALLSERSREEATAELRYSRERLEAVAGPVEGFRAPFFRRRNDLTRLLRAAGYRYDASLGSVYPGPHNRRLHGLQCPYRQDGFWEFPTSAMCGGLFPFSLTWLRLLGPIPPGQMPRSAKLMYLHLHEFLPAETASCLPTHLRRLLTRNCGERAWGILDRALDTLGGELTTCRSILEAAEQGARKKGENRG